MDLDLLDSAAGEVSGENSKERSSVVKNNFIAAKDVNPDQEVEARRIAEVAEVPLETARKQPELVKQQQTSNDFDKIGMNDKAPITADFFTDPNNVRVAKDDSTSLMELEYQFTPEAENNTGPEMREYFGPEPDITSIPRSLANSVSTGFSLANEGLKTMLSDAMGWDMAAESSIREAEKLRARQDLLRPNYASGFASAVHSGAESFAINSPGIVASLATMNPAPALALAGGLTQTEAYTRYRARGATPSEAFLASTGEGAVEVATELLPMSFVIDKLGKKGMQEVLQQRFGDTLSSLGGFAAREVPGEQVATFLQDAIDTAVANPDKTWDDFVNERPSAAYQTLVATLTGSTLFAGSRAGARFATRGRREEEEQRITGIAQSALNSNLRKRDPKLFKRFMDKVADQAPHLSDFFVSPNALAQSGVNLEELGDLSPELLTEMRTAEQTGRDARIPVSEFTANLVETPTGEALLDHLKLGPQSMSKIEADQYLQEQGAELQAEVEQVMAKREKDTAFTEDKQKVHDEITAMLDGVGRFTNDVNTANATLASNFYAVQADRLGITPTEMFKKYPVKVQSTLGQGFSFADYAQTTDKGFKKWFSGSVVKDDKGEPIKVFHGTDQDLTEFNTEGRFKTQGAGAYFSSSPAIAGTYVPNRGGAIYPTYLALKNPLEVNAEGSMWNKISPEAKLPNGRTVGEVLGITENTTTDDIAKQARNLGYDSAIIRNTIDRGSRSGLFDETPSDQAADIYVAFEANQVKSVHNPQPTEGPDILNQSANGMSVKEAQRNGIGLYSGLEREILSMRIPNWKPNPKLALTEAEETELAELQGTSIEKMMEETIGGRPYTISKYEGFDRLEELNTKANSFKPSETEEGKLELDEHGNNVAAITAEESAERMVLKDELEDKLAKEKDAWHLKRTDMIAERAAKMDPLLERKRMAEGLASGKEIWQKIASLPVKKEELEWVGIEDFLLASSDKLTRDEVAEFVRNNGVEVQETVADQELDEDADYVNFGQGEEYDDPDAWENDAENYLDDEDLKEEAEDQAFDEIEREEQDYIGKNFEGRRGELRTALFTEEYMDWVRENFAQEIADRADSLLQELAETKAEEAYRDNPYMFYKADLEDVDLYIFGNDDLGYSLREGGTDYSNSVGDMEAYSLGEAEIQAQEYAREEGYTREGNEDDYEVAKWGDYVMKGDAENYRELKLTLPNLDNGNVDFEHDVHFPDPNVVAFIRVDDRKFVDPDALETNTAKQPETAPDDFKGPSIENMYRKVQVGEINTKLENGPVTLRNMVAAAREFMVDNEVDVQSFSDALNKIEEAIQGDTVPEGLRFLGSTLTASIEGHPTSHEKRVVEQVIAATDALGAAEINKRRLQDQWENGGNRELAAEQSKTNTYFIDEFQSDWHSEGRKEGYVVTDQDERTSIHEELNVLEKEVVRLNGLKLKAREAKDNVFHRERKKYLGEFEAGKYDEFIIERKVNEKTRFYIESAMRDLDNGEPSELMKKAPKEMLKASNRGVLYDEAEDVHLHISKDMAIQSEEFIKLKAVEDKLEAEERDAESKTEPLRKKLRSDIPHAPFKGDAWLSLGLKRALVDAVEGGYDTIAWPTNDEMQSRWSDQYDYSEQYDRKMPSLLKKLTKTKPFRFDAGDGNIVWIAPITKKLRERVKNEGFPLFQNKESVTRGAFNPDDNTITLLKDADLSTFLHEFGHFALEVQVDIASNPSAPEQVKNDLDSLFKWFKVDGKTRNLRLSTWRSMTLEQKREMHEKLARGFESYLMEGKAPSAELRPFFTKFRDWLVSVYKQLKNLNVQLTPEVRQVFDRMLATDAAIEEAENIAKYEPLFKDAEQSGMSTNEFAQYQKLGSQATVNAKEILDRRNMRDMQWLSNARSSGIKKMQKKVEGLRSEVRAEVTQAVNAEPIYRAMEFLKRGTIDGEKAGDGFNKLSIEELEVIYADSPILNSIKRKLGYGKYGMLGTENGVHPDQVAELFGYSSGDQLVRALVEAEPVKEKIAGLTDQRMLEKHGDLTDPDTIEKAVMSSLRNDTRAKFVAAEVAALNNAVGGRKFLADAARQYSEEMIARQVIKDIRPYQYEVAEAKASREAIKAFGKSDIETAAGHKRNQLINLYAAKGARKAIEDVEKGIKYFKRFERKKKGKATIDAEYQDQIDALLERYDLKRVTNKAVDRRASLREWIATQEEQGLEPDIPADLVDDVQKRSYKELTVSEFRGLKDSIRQIEHLGRMKNKLLTAKKQRQFDVAKDEILESLAEYAPNKHIDLRTRTNAGGTAKEMGVSFLAMHRKMASLMQEMDGFKEAGPMWEYIVRGMNEAGDHETTLREKSTLKLADITESLLENQDILGGKGEFFPSLNMSLNKEERLGIALNLGNEGNMQRLLDGEGWTKQQLDPVLDTFTKADWDFIQNVWDYFESFRPAIAAKERRVYGREPEWVEPTPIQTKHGQYPGGYYPIKYDAKRSGASQQFQEAEDAKQMMQNAFTASTTRRSFTKSRAREVVGRPLLYSFQGIYQGTEEIIHDLTHHEWLIDVNKFLRDTQIDKTVRKLYGADAADLIKKAVRDIAVGNQPAQNVWERGLNHVRMGATVAGLGWNFATAFLQPLGLSNSMARIGPGWVGRGISTWFKNPKDSVEEIYEKSEFMRLRAKTMQREINEIQNKLQQPGAIQTGVGKVIGAGNTQKAKEVFQWSIFLTIQKMQLVADIPTWLGQYEKSISEGKDDATASRLSDQAVIDSQGGGLTKDLAEIQRGGPMQKLWTNFYSYFSVVYNLNADIKRRTDWKDPYQVSVAARDYLLVMVVPAVLGKMMKDVLTGDDEDWTSKKYAKALAAEQLSYLFGTMVGLRETAAVAQRVAGVSQYNGSYGGPAGLRIFQEFDKLGAQVSQGKMDRALRKSLINTSGILFHLPAAQVNRTLDGIEAMAEGKAGPLAIIGGHRR